jgi:predicted DNA-binding transcriptional regulator YafY
MARNQEMIRQWDILRTLDARRMGSHINELAAQYGVNPRTIRRDLYALQAAGFPLQELTRDNKKYWSVDARLFQRLGDLGLSLPELAALYFGRTILHCLVGPPFRDDVQSALGKIATVLPARLRDELDRVHSAFAVKGDPNRHPADREYQKHVTHLVNAVLAHRRVALRYYSMASGREKDYLVEPLRLVFGEGALYLRAYVPDYEDVRTFAITRMREVTPTEETFTPREESAEDPFRNSIGINDGKPIPVELEFTRTVASYVCERTWHPSQTVEPMAGGRVRFRLNVSDDLALRSWILGFGRNVRVLSPQSLAEWVREELEQMRTAYASAAAAADGQVPLPFDAVAPVLLGFTSTGTPGRQPAPSRSSRKK